MKKIPIIAIGMTLGLLSHAQQTIPIDKRSTDTEVVLASSTKDVEYARDAIAQIQQADEDNASNSASDYSVSLPSTGSQQTEDVSSNDAMSIANKAAASVVYIQNETITGPKTYTGTVVKIGSNVTDAKAHGPVKFNGGVITINGSEIQINPQTTISNTTTFKAIIK